MSSVDEALDTWNARRTISGAVVFVVSVLATVGGAVSLAEGVRDLPWYAWVPIGWLVIVAYRFVVGS